jgi:AcrR family transcriptional regulator
VAGLRPDTGRVRQKERTRRALIAAAAELLRAGRAPTVAEAAAAAGVHRATAYRYFPSQDLLLAPATILVGTNRFADQRLLDTGNTTDPAERAALVTRRVAEAVLDEPDIFRTAIRLSLDPDLDYRRPGRRHHWIADLLGPLDLDPRTRRRLAGALTILLGSEVVVALTDVGELPRDEVLDVLTWMTHTLVDGALGSGASTTAQPA